MEKVSFKPNKFLSKYIDRFYLYKKSSSLKFGLPIVLPGTGLELLFHLENSLYVNNNKLEESHIICPRTVFKFDKTNNVNFISVRFKSGTFRHFTSIPYSELNDSYLSITEIWKNKGYELLNRLNETENLKQKIELIENFLILRLTENKVKKNEKWDDIISILYGEFKTVNLIELSKKSHLSYRQFERNFKDQFGITAKKFQMITRLQDTIKKSLLNDRKIYLHNALDNGYFDQSHFINEFQNLVGLKPMDYLLKENSEENFYFDPIDSKPAGNKV